MSNFATMQKFLWQAPESFSSALSEKLSLSGPRKHNFGVEFATKEVRIILTSSHLLSTNFMQIENQGWLCSVTTRVEPKMESSENQPSEHPTRTTCPGSVCLIG